MKWLKATGIVFGFCLLIGLINETSKWYQSHCPQNIQVAIGVIAILIAIILLGKAIDDGDKKHEKQSSKKTSKQKNHKKVVRSK